MPFDPVYADRFFGHPDADSTLVRVNCEENRRAFGRFDGPSIPIDYRSYIVYGYTILPTEVKISTNVEIDTRKPTLRVSEGFWHIDGLWYRAFEPDALNVLGVAPEQARPSSWLTNVPIQTVEQPPYTEGQVLHGCPPPAPFKPKPYATSGEKVGGGWLTSIKLEVGERLLWSCRATRATSAIKILKSLRGGLFLTSRRVLFCPNVLHHFLGGKPFMARIRELTDVGCKPIETSDLGDDRKMGLRLILVGGREEAFAVDDLIRAVEAFAQQIHPIG